MPLAVIVAIACLGGILVWILRRIVPAFSALSSIKALRNGKTAKLSIARIASLNVNLPDAKRALTEEEFARVYALYKRYQADRSRATYTPEEYAIQAAKIVVSFDKVAPYIKYSGEHDPIEAENKLVTAYDILDNSPKAENNPDREPQGHAPRKNIWLVGSLAFVCLGLAVCSLWLWHETQTLHTEIAVLSEEKSQLEARVSDVSGKIARRDVEYRKLQNEKEEVEKHLDAATGYGFEMYVQLSKIGFIVNDSPYFHHFECDTYKGAGNYLAHNIEYCAYLGYSKCPKCWES